MAVPMASVTSDILAEDLKPRKRITRDRVPQRPNAKGGKPGGGKKFSGKPSGGYKGKKPNHSNRPKSA